MFYSELILHKRSPLGRVWLAAHWERKVTKQQYMQTDIVKSCEFILKPGAPLALRLSGKLLFGVTRIFSRQVHYLFTDSQDAMQKIKMAFRPGGQNSTKIDMLPANVAGLSRITLPETDIDLERLAAGGGDLGLGSRTLPNFADFVLPDEDLLELQVDGESGVVTARKERIPFEVGGVGAGLDEGEFTMFEGFGADDMADEFVPIGMSQVEESLRDPSVEIQRHDKDGGLPDFEDIGAGGGFDDSTFDAAFDPFGEVDIAGAGGATPIGKGPILDESMTGAGTPGELRDISIAAPSPNGGISFRDWEVTADKASAEAAVAAASVGVVKPAAGASRPRKRKAVKVDETLEISSDDYREMLENTSPTLSNVVPAPSSKRAMLLKKERDAGPRAAMRRVGSLPGLSPELVALFTRNMTASASAAAAAAAAAAEGEVVKTDFEFADEFGQIGGTFDESFQDMGGFQAFGEESDFIGGGVSFDNEPVAFGPERTIADEEADEQEGVFEEGFEPQIAAAGVSQPTVMDSEGVSKRTRKMQLFLRKEIEKAEAAVKATKGRKKAQEPSVSFFGLVGRDTGDAASRNVVVSSFLEMLVLAGKERVRLSQGAPYGDISITRGDKHDIDLVTEQEVRLAAQVAF